MGAKNSCEISRVPQDCLSRVISLTSPRDACRCLAVSTFFQSAATADAVWEHFLPSEIDSILSRTAQPPAFASKKELYFHLCNHGIITDDGRMKLRLERSSGAKIYMLSAAKALGIIWGDDPQYWQRVAHHDSEFSEVAQLLFVQWLEIDGAINIKNLTPKTKYAAYFIFKLQDDSSGLDLPIHTFVTCGDQDISRYRICLQPRNGRTRQSTNNQIKYPQVREDRWTEIEVGEFYVNGEDILAVAKVLEVKGLWQKRGLIVNGIEFRPKTESYDK